MKTITLIIKKKWFDLILSGEKTVEYRNIKPYYTSRFRNAGAVTENEGIIGVNGKTRFLVRFRAGYRKDGKKLTALCRLRLAIPKEKNITNEIENKRKLCYAIVIEKVLETE